MRQRRKQLVEGGGKSVPPVKPFGAVFQHGDTVHTTHSHTLKGGAEREGGSDLKCKVRSVLRTETELSEYCVVMLYPLKSFAGLTEFRETISSL